MNGTATLAALKAITATLPEVEVEASGRHAAFSVRGKRFAWHLVDHHGDGRLALECKAARGESEALVAADPTCFFLPPYLAQHGWVGIYLDGTDVDWEQVGDLLTEAYRLVAPRRLAAKVGPPEP